MSGDELKFSRQRIGLTHEDLARFARVSVGTVARWESGGSSIPRALRLRILLAQLVSCPINNFTIPLFHLKVYLSETSGFLIHS